MRKKQSPSKPANTAIAKGSPSHELRIIGGQWKRSKIKVIDKPGLRPTPDRVRETLFNWLGQDLTGWMPSLALALWALKRLPEVHKWCKCLSKILSWSACC